MVPDHERGSRPRAPGKLKGDRRIEAAAVALLHGIDPIPFLAGSPDDTEIRLAALSRASELAQERDKWLVESVATRTSGLTAKLLTKWLGNAFRQMFKD